MKKIILCFSLLVLSSLFAQPDPIKFISESFEPTDHKHEKKATLSISEFLFEGKFIILSDGTVWCVHPKDRIKILGWIGVDNIEFGVSDDKVFNILLINPATSDQVLARKATSHELNTHKRSF